MSSGMRFGVCMIVVGLTLMGVPILPIIGIYLIIKYGSRLIQPHVDRYMRENRRNGFFGN